MDTFSFVFSFFTIVLGLAMTEVLTGMRKAIQSRKKVRIGWLTPLLGLVVALDMTSFWTNAWQVKELIPPYYLALCGGFMVTGLYYFAAGLVFPDDPAEWPNYDEYYFAHRRVVVGSIICCNLLANGFQKALGFDLFTNWFPIAAVASFYVLCTLLFFARTKTQNIVLLSVLAASGPAWSLLDSALYYLGLY